MVERTQPLADTGRMARKPEQPKTWTVYKVAAKAILLGTIEASSSPESLRLLACQHAKAVVARY
jgi:hypothetical protein